MKASLYVLFFVLVCLFSNQQAVAGVVDIRDNQLWIDNQAQPQLFGAELQYFRLRGGQGRNIPRAKVIALWNQALDRMVEAKMNAISFYIPWDFHEYAEGKFDFKGTVDEDGDGNPDYPSRDVVTFLKLIEKHGIKHIMARPGPYINAEWGFLGFGAIPLWFHQKYPDSHMQNAQGLRTKLYDYHSADLLRHTQIWFKEVYTKVLAKYIGVGRPISFMQLDNETNFMWQSLYNHDYSPRAVKRYQQFLMKKYGPLPFVNAVHQREWKQWSDIRPPIAPWLNLAEDQDWYRFQDESIHSYLQLVRTYWENLGVREPQVLFTLAESYNATATGLLPNYHYRNEANKTGMMTVNLYPKTYDIGDGALLNTPFKADHDVKAADRAKEAYMGRGSEWAMGPEIQGGWWKGVPVSAEGRRQTYLTVLGHGLKAFFVYYFNEGQNWQSDWGPDQVRPYFNTLRSTPEYASFADNQLPEKFWNELQATVDRQVIVGLDVRHLTRQDLAEARELFFDAPLDGNAQPRGHFNDLKELGEKVIAPNKEFLGRAVEMTDPVCFIKDDNQHVPSPIPGLDSVAFNSDWASGLLGYLLQAGVNPRFVHWGLNPASDLHACRVILFQDSGIANPDLLKTLKALVKRGKTVVSFLGDQMSKVVGLQVGRTKINPNGSAIIDFNGEKFAANGSVLFSYDLSRSAECEAQLFHGANTVGYRCAVDGKANSLWQVGTLFYDVFNSNAYGFLNDVPARRAWLDKLLSETGVVPQVRVVGGGDRLAVYGRRDPKGNSKWITIKNSQEKSVSFRIEVQDVQASAVYAVTNLFTSVRSVLTGQQIRTGGFAGDLNANGSTVYFIEKQ